MAEGMQSRGGPAVFVDLTEPVDCTGTLSVLGHRAIGTLSTAGLAIGVVQSVARTAEDDAVLAACRRVEQLLGEAADVIRAEIVVRATTWAAHR